MAKTISDIPFFKDLTPEELGTVKACLREKTFQKGEVLFTEGGSCERVFFVKSGKVKIFRMSEAGREQVLETLDEGDTCACNPGELKWHCSSSAEAVTPSTVWFLARENYVKLVQSNTKVARTLNKLFAERLQCFSSLIEEVSLKDSKKRLVKFLLDMMNQSSSKKSLDLPYTREELAKRLGIVRETVARQLHDLKRRKLISIEPQKVTILDPKGLEKLLQ